MIDYIILLLLVVLILIFSIFLISFRAVRRDIDDFHHRLSDLEEIQSIDYMVPYEKDGKKGKKRIKHMVYQDDKDEIYLEESDNKMYHETKK
jgi:hypothetical protein